LKLVQKDGTSKDILISVDPVISGAEMSGYAGVIANIPKNITKSLKHGKLLNEFLQITVHEMATPISLVKGFTELLLKDYDQKQGFNEIVIDSLLRNTKKLERQIIALRDAQEAKDGIFSIKKKSISFEEFKAFLESDIDIFKEKSRIKLELKDSRDTNNLIKIDPDRMAQVIFNLVENGCHHSPKTEDVFLKVSLTNNNLEIRIIDNGVGFSKEKIRKVFQPFFSESTEYYKKGMGLGLFISHNIVNKHGGKISLRSKLREGSEFIVSIPV
ncbi:MAG: sensor histidine kinase, partial [Candidatus Hodarchaeales archaeon]